MNWRLASRLSVITLAVLVVILVLTVQDGHSLVSTVTNIFGSHSAGAASLQGDNLGSTPAPNFTLTDQNGQQVSLAQYHGKPVILTFLYTHCPDECPLTAERLHAAMLALGPDASKIGVLAVSTDPVGDTKSAAQNFTQAHNMQNYWHYLIGSRSQLSPVWKNYNIYVQNQQALTDHTLAIYIIDKQGNERAFFGGTDFTPDQVKQDMQMLLKE